jgi:hypothetical protein
MYTYVKHARRSTPSGKLERSGKKEVKSLLGKRMGQSVPSSKARTIGGVHLKAGEYIKGGDKRHTNPKLDAMKHSRHIRKPGWASYRGDLDKSRV